MAMEVQVVMIHVYSTRIYASSSMHASSSAVLILYIIINRCCTSLYMFITNNVVCSLQRRLVANGQS
jgi:hypothetical protein